MWRAAWTLNVCSTWSGLVEVLARKLRYIVASRLSTRTQHFFASETSEEGTMSDLSELAQQVVLTLRDRDLISGDLTLEGEHLCIRGEPRQRLFR